MSSRPRKDSGDGPASAGRRSLLRKAALTAPMIGTIPSGAALARSSNLISASPEGGATDAWGRTLCLDERFAESTTSTGTTYDLGEPPYGEVNAIRARDYRVEAKWGADEIREADMCRRGGTYYYRRYGWQKVSVPRGMLVSATALSSFAGSIVVRDI